MKRLTVNDGLSTLFPCGGELELRSPAGEVLGHFVAAAAGISPGDVGDGNGEPKQLIVDEALRNRLCGLSDSLELLDASGRVIGHVLPVQDRTVYDGVDSPTDPAELMRRASEPGGRTWAEIRADLEKIA